MKDNASAMTGIELGTAPKTRDLPDLTAQPRPRDEQQGKNVASTTVTNALLNPSSLSEGATYINPPSRVRHRRGSQYDSSRRVDDLARSRHVSDGSAW